MSEIAIVWGAELRKHLRSARVLVLFGLYAMFSGLTLLVAGFFAQRVQAQVDLQLSAGASEEAVQRMMEEMRRSFIGTVFSDDASMIESLGKIPILVLVVFKITLFFLPAYVAVMGFDQVSGEVGPRSIRYLTLRCRRSSILVGKFLAQASLLLGLTFFIDLAIMAVARGLNSDFAFSVMTASLVKFWLASAVFSLAYLAITIFCSSLFRNPALSLVVNFVVLFAFWVVNVVGAQGADYVQRLEASDEPVSWIARAVATLRYFTPSAYSTDLLHPHLGEFGLSAAAFAIFAAGFLGASWGVFRQRDV
jgi:ABC-2 type transport system permease protein